MARKERPYRGDRGLRDYLLGKTGEFSGTGKGNAGELVNILQPAEQGSDGDRLIPYRERRQ